MSSDCNRLNPSNFLNLWQHIAKEQDLADAGDGHGEEDAEESEEPPEDKKSEDQGDGVKAHLLAQNKGETGGLGGFSDGEDHGDADEQHEHGGGRADSQ